MGRLRDKMEGDLRLCGLSENTRKAYLRCVAKFSRHYGKSPSKLGRAEIRDYLLHLIEGRKCSTSTYNVYISALAFLYRQTLGRPQDVWWIKRVKVRRNIPHILTGEEVERILAKLTLRMRVMALLAYGSGLRISEICQLRIEDIHSDRMMIHVQQGKGDRPRRALLPRSALLLLRVYWRDYKLKGPWMFPGRKPGHTLTRAAFTKALGSAVRRAKITKRVTPHSFRHAFATSLLEAGADLRTVQVLLGHASIRSTVWYVQVTPAVLRKVISPADRLHKTVAPSGTSPRDTAAEGHDDVTRHDVTRRVS